MKWSASAVAIMLCLTLTLGAVGCSKSAVRPSAPAGIRVMTPGYDNTPTFVWDGAADSDAGIAYYLVSMDTESYEKWVKIGNVTSYAYDSPLDIGSHTFYVKAVDNAGNESDAESCTFTLHYIPSVEILSHSSYLSGGTYWVVGEVKNNNSYQLNYMKITATFYNAAGTVVGTKDGDVLVHPLIPNQKSPFVVYELDQAISAQIDHYTLAVSGFTVAGTEPYRGLAILSHSASRIALYTVDGEIQNTGTEAVDVGFVFVTFYDTAGQVVDVGIAPLSNLAAGQATHFMAMASVNASAGISSYELQAQ